MSVRQRTPSPQPATPLFRQELMTSVTVQTATASAAPRSSIRLIGPGDPGAAGDGVRPVREAHPGLVGAVVVGRPQHQPGRVAADRAALVALRIEAAPDADERVGLPLVADRGR